MADPGAGQMRPRGRPAGRACRCGVDRRRRPSHLWRHGGDVVRHILRPRAGGPAIPAWRTVSVTAASCAEASAASTAAIIRGSQAIGWLSGLGLPSRLVDTAGRVRTVAGWPAAEDLAGTGRRATAAHGNSAGAADAGGKAGAQ